MSEAQFVAILVGFAITILASIGTALTALLVNNSRLSDLKDYLRGEIASVNSRVVESKASLDSRITEMKDTVRAEIKAGDAAIISQMATYQMDLISKIAELDNRITRLER